MSYLVTLTTPHSTTALIWLLDQQWSSTSITRSHVHLMPHMIECTCMNNQQSKSPWKKASMAITKSPTVQDVFTDNSYAEVKRRWNCYFKQERPADGWHYPNNGIVASWMQCFLCTCLPSLWKSVLHVMMIIVTCTWSFKTMWTKVWTVAWRWKIPHMSVAYEHSKWVYYEKAFSKYVSIWNLVL